MQPSVVLQAHHIALLPIPPPQLLTASAMGVPYRPPAPTQHYALYATPPLGDQSFGLVGAQYPTGPLPGTVPPQQLLLQYSAPHTTQYTAQHAFYSSPLHQNIQASAYISPYFTPSHGYAGPHATTLGGVTVDLEEHFRATHTAYAALALAAPVSTAATSDALLTRWVI